MSVENVFRIGPRLKAARERSGLTQQGLADALGLTHRQTVASIESGERRLRASELVRAIGILGVDVDYFTDPFRLVGEGQFTFWTSQHVERQVLDEFEERAGRWIAAYLELSSEQDDPPRWLGHKLNLTSKSSTEDAQAAGEAAADRWCPGPRPAERLCSAMEGQLDILVLHVDPPYGISGAAAQVRGLNCALVNRRESEERRNFDLAHALFQLLTWDTLPPARTTSDMERRGRRWRVDQLTKSFVVALLMPEAATRLAWERTFGSADLSEKVSEMASAMGVPSEMCRSRLHDLGIVTKADVEGIDDRSLALQWTPRPRATERPPFSAEFARRVASALEAGRLSVRRAAQVLDLGVGELARLLRDHGYGTYFESAMSLGTCVAENRSPTWRGGGDL